MARPRKVSSTSSRRAAGANSAWWSSSTERRTESVSGTCPSSTVLNRSANSAVSCCTSTAFPSMTMRSPRTVSRASKDSSSTWRISSEAPTTRAISTPPGAVSVVCIKSVMLAIVPYVARCVVRLLQNFSWRSLSNKLDALGEHRRTSQLCFGRRTPSVLHEIDGYERLGGADFAKLRTY